MNAPNQIMPVEADANVLLGTSFANPSEVLAAYLQVSVGLATVAVGFLAIGDGFPTIVRYVLMPAVGFGSVFISVYLVWELWRARLMSIAMMLFFAMLFLSLMAAYTLSISRPLNDALADMANALLRFPTQP